MRKLCLAIFFGYCLGVVFLNVANANHDSEEMMEEASPVITYGNWVLQDPLPNTIGNSDVRLLREISYDGGKYQHGVPDDFIYDNSPLQPGDTVEVYHRVKGKKGELYNTFTVNGDAEAAKKVKNNITQLTEEGKSYSVEVYMEPEKVEEVTPPTETPEVIEEIKEVQGPVQPDNVKRKSKADKLVDGITDTWKSINSLDDICHAGNIYLETPEVNGFSLQYKNERCEEYVGVKFKWRF